MPTSSVSANRSFGPSYATARPSLDGGALEVAELARRHTWARLEPLELSVVELELEAADAPRGPKVLVQDLRQELDEHPRGGREHLRRKGLNDAHKSR